MLSSIHVGTKEVCTQTWLACDFTYICIVFFWQLRCLIEIVAMTDTVGIATCQSTLNDRQSPMRRWLLMITHDYRREQPTTRNNNYFNCPWWIPSCWCNAWILQEPDPLTYESRGGAPRCLTEKDVWLSGQVRSQNNHESDSWVMVIAGYTVDACCISRWSILVLEDAQFLRNCVEWCVMVLNDAQWLDATSAHLGFDAPRCSPCFGPREIDWLPTPLTVSGFHPMFGKNGLLSMDSFCIILHRSMLWSNMYSNLICRFASRPASTVML